VFGLFKFLVSIPLIVGILNPQLAWEMSEGWKFKNAEPSEAYLIMTRVMSVVILFVLWFLVQI